MEKLRPSNISFKAEQPNKDQEQKEKPFKKIKRVARKYARSAVLGAALLGVGAEKMDDAEFPKDKIARARQDLVQKGVTREQAAAYKPGVNDLIHRGINPYGYSVEDKVKYFATNLIHGRKVLDKDVPYLNETMVSKEREDAYRLYLGLPQINNTFGISDYRPQKSKDDKYYFKINDFWKKKAEQNHQIIATELKSLYEQYQDNLNEGRNDLFLDGLVMNQYKFSLGEDKNGHFMSYYDLWDLDIQIEKGNSFFGKPFEIYDRIYYNPTTFEPLNVNPAEKEPNPTLK